MARMRTAVDHGTQPNFLLKIQDQAPGRKSARALKMSRKTGIFLFIGLVFRRNSLIFHLHLHFLVTECGVDFHFGRAVDIDRLE